jgi:hypothetical protein
MGTDAPTTPQSSRVATADAMTEYNHAGSPEIPVVFREECPISSALSPPPCVLLGSGVRR